MKKQLLILFISFAFIGSVNANSIKGAFGYKLGQIVNVPTEHEIEGVKHYFHSGKDFIPKKPIFSLNDYSFITTFTDKRIHTIQARKVERASPKNSCKSNVFNGSKWVESDFEKTRVLLEAKYGAFSKPKFNQNYLPYENWIKQWRDKDNKLIRSQHVGLEFFDKERSITLTCDLHDDWGSYFLFLTYTDHNLLNRANEESSEMAKKIMDEDFDI